MRQTVTFLAYVSPAAWWHRVRHNKWRPRSVLSLSTLHLQSHIHAFISATFSTRGEVSIFPRDSRSLHLSLSLPCVCVFFQRLWEPVRAHLAGVCHFSAHCTFLQISWSWMNWPISSTQNKPHFFSFSTYSVAVYDQDNAVIAQAQRHCSSLNPEWKARMLFWQGVHYFIYCRKKNTFVTAVNWSKCLRGWCIFVNYTNKVAKNGQTFSAKNADCSRTLLAPRWKQVSSLPVTQLVNTD